MKPFLATLAALLFVGAASADITVIGHGKIKYVPDMAQVSFSVTAEAESAAQAWAQDAETARKLLKVVHELGIEDRDIKTINLSLAPKYVYPKDAPPRLVGYTVTHQLNVTVRRLDELGRTLDSLVNSGADHLASITFGCSDPSRLLDEARTKAVTDARHKAQLYSEAAGTHLGTLVSISEEGPTPIRPMTLELVRDAKAGAPIAVGEQELSVSVTVVYAIK